jgi:CDP-diacylglycerol--glycerol-3-phosphate 3-phosphatidyltransferase
VPILFVIRGTIVDAIRAGRTRTRRESPFAMMETALGSWLVAGKLMRICYSVLKATAFCWLLLIAPVPALWPQIWAHWAPVLQGTAAVLVYLAVAMCLVRGLPVIVEFVYAERHAILGRLTPQHSGRP